jgi:hypothetical protein
MYTLRYKKVTVTMHPEVLENMKIYLKQLNLSTDIKYVSQSEFVTEAVKQLLQKELEDAKIVH